MNLSFPKILLRSELIRNTSVLITGTVLAQIVSFCLQPVIGRLFPVESFGILMDYQSIIGIITVFSALKYDDAIVIPRTNKESVSLIGLTFIFSLFINLLLLIIVLIFQRKIITLLNLRSDFPLSVLFVIPLSVFLYNVFQGFNLWLIRTKKYNLVSVNKLTRKSSEGVSQIGFALLKAPNGLVFSDIIGQIANVLMASYQAIGNGLTFRNLSIIKLKYVLKKYSEFPKYNLVPSLMSACSYMLPPLMINHFFSVQNGGFFYVSKYILTIPVAIVASSLSSVLLQKVSEKFRNNESIYHELKPVIIIVLIISLLEIAAIMLFGNFIFTLVYGNGWTESGRIARIIVWSFSLNFIVSSFSSVFIAMKKIKLYSAWQAFYFITILSLFFFKNVEFTSFLKIYVGIEVACYLIVISMIIYIISNFESTLPDSK
jgi:O-antigen/teichoic acid export membrane protein